MHSLFKAPWKQPGAGVTCSGQIYLPQFSLKLSISAAKWWFERKVMVLKEYIFIT